MVSTALMVAGYEGAIALAHRRVSAEPSGLQKLLDFAPMSIGARVSMDAVGRGRDSYAFIIVVSPDCVHCRAAAPFFRTLIGEAGRRGVPVALALPDRVRDKSFATTLGARGVPVVDWVELGVKPLGTPMIALVDAGGTVLKYWAGEPSQAAKRELMNAVRQPSAIVNRPRSLPSGQPMVAESDLQGALGGFPVTIVNTLERPLFRGTRYDYPAVNIPLDELRFRSRQELDPAKTQVVDCTFLGIAMCDRTVNELRVDGFRVVAMDNSGSAEDHGGTKEDGK